MLLKRGITCLFVYFLCYLWVKVASFLFNAFWAYKTSKWKSLVCILCTFLCVESFCKKKDLKLFLITFFILLLKLCFTQFSTRIYWNTSLPAPDLFPVFTQSINLCILYCHKIKECRCLKNAIHQLERDKWLLLSAFQQGFQQKLSWSLSSQRKMLFLRGLILKPTERAYVLKNGTRDF